MFSKKHDVLCRSIITVMLLLLWLPFQTVTDTMSDIWRTLVKWNQYVREYETTLLGRPQVTANAGTCISGVSPFAAAKSQTFSPQKEHTVQDFRPTRSQGDHAACTEGLYKHSVPCNVTVVPVLQP